MLIYGGVPAVVDSLGEKVIVLHLIELHFCAFARSGFNVRKLFVAWEFFVFSIARIGEPNLVSNANARDAGNTLSMDIHLRGLC